MTGSLFSFFLLNFCTHTVCLSKDVTGHCTFTTVFYQVPPFLPAFRFDAHTVYLSKDVTGHCCFHCTALPRSFFDLIAFFSLFLPVCVHTVYLSKDVTGGCSSHPCLCLHSVSVQRRDRCSVATTSLLFCLSLLVTSFPLFDYLVRISLLPFLTL